MEAREIATVLAYAIIAKEKATWLENALSQGKKEDLQEKGMVVEITSEVVAETIVEEEEEVIKIGEEEIEMMRVDVEVEVAAVMPVGATTMEEEAMLAGVTAAAKKPGAARPPARKDTTWRLRHPPWCPEAGPARKNETPGWHRGPLTCRTNLRVDKQNVFS